MAAAGAARAGRGRIALGATHDAAGSSAVALPFVGASGTLRGAVDPSYTQARASLTPFATDRALDGGASAVLMGSPSRTA